MGRIKSLIEKNVSDIYVHSLEIGSNEGSDSLNGFFMPVNDQIDLAYSIIKADPKLANGYNAMGFSQGGQFLYAVPFPLETFLTFTIEIIHIWAFEKTCFSSKISRPTHVELDFYWRTTSGSLW